MPRLISCAETIPAVLDGTKTVTRRLGWWTDKNGRRIIHPGDRLTVCAKVMGRQGQPLRRLAEVELVNVTREHLADITMTDVKREGLLTEMRELTRLAGMDPDDPDDVSEAFYDWYCETFGLDPLSDPEVTRIEWRYLAWHEGPRAGETSP